MRKVLFKNLALLHSGKCVPVSILLLSVHTHTSTLTQQHACSHTHIPMPLMNRLLSRLGFPSLYVSFSLPSLHPSIPPPLPSAFPRQLLLTRVQAFDACHSHILILASHTHTCMQIIHQMAAPKKNKLTQM